MCVCVLCQYQVCHLSIKGVFSVSTRSVTEEAHNVWQEVSSDSHRVRQDIVDSDLEMDQVVRNCVKICEKMVHANGL